MNLQIRDLVKFTLWKQPMVIYKYIESKVKVIYNKQPAIVMSRRNVEVLIIFCFQYILVYNLILFKKQTLKSHSESLKKQFICKEHNDHTVWNSLNTTSSMYWASSNNRIKTHWQPKNKTASSCRYCITMN